MSKNLKRMLLLVAAVVPVLVGINVYAGNKQNPTERKTKAVKVDSSKVEAAPAMVGQAKNQLVVYYFMTTRRCYSCNFIEGTTRKALDEYFSGEQKSGRVVFRMVNIDEPQNRHFVDEYGLYTKSVVLSDLKGGQQARWKNLDKVWNMIGDYGAFIGYIENEVKAYLGS